MKFVSWTDLAESAEVSLYMFSSNTIWVLSFLGFIYNPPAITTDKNYFLVKTFFLPLYIDNACREKKKKKERKGKERKIPSNLAS